MAPYGDVNGSGQVNIADVLCIVLGSLAESASQALPSCLSGERVLLDLNCDAEVTVGDATIGLHLVLGVPLPQALDADADGCPSACSACAPAESGSCLIVGICVPHGNAKPGEPCRVCDTTLNPIGWSIAPAGCPAGVSCQQGAECTSGLCEGGVCIGGLCEDGVLSGQESDVDCGGPDCAPCAAGSVCNLGLDCAHFVCLNGQCATSVEAEFGGGTDGDLTVTGNQTHVVPRSRVVAVTPETLTLQDAAGFASGDEILVLAVQSETAPGTHEFAFVRSVVGNMLTLASPLRRSFISSDNISAQKVPHYQAVSIAGTLTASPWDGASGGVLAFRASGIVHILVGGALRADARGFAGGVRGDAGALIREGGQGETWMPTQSFRCLVEHGGAGGGGEYSASGTGDTGGGGGGGGGAGGSIFIHASLAHFPGAAPVATGGAGGQGSLDNSNVSGRSGGAGAPGKVLLAVP